MRISFTKMNGAGNDFVMIRDADRAVRASREWIRRVCDRRRGIGADGVILVEPEDGVDFRMVYFNSDGGEAEMCGNGARCASLFAASLGMGRRTGDEVALSFVARPGKDGGDGSRGKGGGIDDGRPRVREGGFDRCSAREGDRASGQLGSASRGHRRERLGTRWATRRWTKRGRAIRYHEKFAPAGVNADFVRVDADGRCAIRTYERGVEAETLACGTGAVASAVVLSHLGLAESPVELVTRGGDV